jgi:hypothetical protein
MNEAAFEVFSGWYDSYDTSVTQPLNNLGVSGSLQVASLYSLMNEIELEDYVNKDSRLRLRDCQCTQPKGAGRFNDSVRRRHLA